jgi:hypothetical protein
MLNPRSYLDEEPITFTVQMSLTTVLKGIIAGNFCTITRNLNFRPTLFNQRIKVAIHYLSYMLKV